MIPPRGFPWWGALGLAVFAAGVWALATDAPVWNTVWYLPAWYGYLLVLDAALARLQGFSFLRGRPRELLAMMFWSVPFWFFFEACNLRLENWYYVSVLRNSWARGIAAFLCFATVLPACFFHAELARALGWFRNARCRPLRVTARLQASWIVFGILCLALPLALPRYAFWMVWGATFWIPDVVCYRSGAPSVLGDLESGRPGRLWRLLAGGLLAGLVWETLNYWARSKWIYTVPGFESSKLFEMPGAGFLGFPVLSVAAFSFYSMLSRFLRGGRSWEKPDGQPSRPARGGIHAAAAALSLVASFAVYQGVLAHTVRSERPVLAEIEGLDPGSIARLRAAGVPTPERLVRAARKEGIVRLAAESGVDAGRLGRAAGEAALALHKGMGPAAASLLEAAGISNVRDLAAADPETLAVRLRPLARSRGERAPRPAEVRVWVRAAKGRDRPAR